MPQIPYSHYPLYSYKHIAATGTLSVKSAAGALHRVIVNSATNGAVVTFYDNTAASGTVIAVYTFGAAVTSPLSITYEDIAFLTGLTIVVSTQNADLTIMYN